MNEFGIWSVPWIKTCREDFLNSVILPLAFSYNLDTAAVLPISKCNFIKFTLGRLLNLHQNQLLWTFSLLLSTAVLNAVI